MSILGTLLSREDRYAALLIAGALEVQATIKALEHLVTSPNPAVSLAAFVQARAKEQEIKEQIDALLCQRAMGRLDHGDIVALALGLNRISKTTRRFAERHLLCADRLPAGVFATQLTMLDEAALTMRMMVAELMDGPKVAAAKRHNDVLQGIKGRADKLFTAAVVDLYQGRHEPVTAIMLRDLYEVLDRIFDRFRNTGNSILQIVLKQS
jgi:uncharacterized protein Yka (UPF0111/DUF47 family)